MKIWYQSGASVGYDPIFDDYGTTLTSYLNKVARPGTEVTVRGVELCSPYVDIYQTAGLLQDHQILKKLLQAQNEGYDAFCVGDVLDPAFYPLREVAEIPVCSIAEASMLVASLLSPNFSILCHNNGLMRRVIEIVRRLRLEERFIQCNSLDMPLTELQKGYIDPKILLEPAEKIAREAANKGVCMFITCCGCISMILAKYNVRDIGGIPVLEGGATALKVTEMLVDLENIGIERSKLGLFTQIPKDELSSLLKVYSLNEKDSELQIH